MKKVGMDLKFREGATLWGNVFESLQAVRQAGLDGVILRTIDEVSPSLDPGYLTDVAQAARDLGLYVEVGVGKVNPYMTAELPRVRDIGGGDYLLGMTRMFRACAKQGWTQLWSATAGFKPGYTGGIFFVDRFRTDAPWGDQLRAIESFLRKLAPVLRDTGVRLNLETHEEITTFELVRLIEAVGDDVLGVCLDTGNLPVNAEIPAEGVRRVARYVHMTHLRDAALLSIPDGLARFLAPCGEGVMDWTEILGLLSKHAPQSLNLSIEGIGATRAEMPIRFRDPAWRAGHPDLSDESLAAFIDLGDRYQSMAARGERPNIESLRSPRSARPAHEEFVARCAARIRSVLNEGNDLRSFRVLRLSTKSA